jgi:hypothetical protein
MHLKKKIRQGGVREGEGGRNDPTLYAHMNKVKIKKDT